jgi:hypothetical protein
MQSDVNGSIPKTTLAQIPVVSPARTTKESATAAASLWPAPRHRNDAFSFVRRKLKVRLTELGDAECDVASRI